MLVEGGALLDARSKYGSAALHEAAVNGHLECCAVLVHAGAPLGLRDLAGQTALDQAVEVCSTQPNVRHAWGRYGYLDIYPSIHPSIHPSVCLSCACAGGSRSDRAEADAPHRQTDRTDILPYMIVYRGEFRLAGPNQRGLNLLACLRRRRMELGARLRAAGRSVEYGWGE